MSVEKKNQLFENTLSTIKQNKKNLDENHKPNCIPFEWFPRLRTVLPGIIRGTNWMITAGTGIGKTQFSKHTFVYKPIEWIKNHPESGLSYKILYFGLEESKEEFMMTMIANRLFEKYGIRKSVLELQSMFEKSIDDDIINKVEECRDYFNDLDDHLEVIDSISNPTGIYKYVRDYSLRNGKHYFKTQSGKELIASTKEEYSKILDQMRESRNDRIFYDRYEPNNPDEYTGVIVDHFSLVEPEKGAETQHKAMSRLSADYGRKIITKHYKYFFVDVQQQAADGEKAEFTKMGTKIEEKFKPTLANVADNKLTPRDCHVVIGLFSPAKHNINQYQGYSINKVGDKFRSAIILKNRIGAGFIELPLYFNGVSNTFKELPPAYDMTEEIYKQIQNS